LNLTLKHVFSAIKPFFANTLAKNGLFLKKTTLQLYQMNFIHRFIFACINEFILVKITFFCQYYWQKIGSFCQ